MGKKKKTGKNNVAMKFAQVPPQNIEAEEALLSAILFDPQTVYDIIEVLEPSDFYKAAHKEIFEAMLALFNANEPIDLVTLTDRLKQLGKLDEAGGPVYISSLMETVPLATNAPQYGKIVREHSTLRRMILYGSEIMSKCYLEEERADDVIDFAERCVFEISQNKIKPAFMPISKIIERNIDSLEDRQGNQSMITGVPTGFRTIDRMMSGLQNSDMIILAARPSMGKTALALNMARNAAMEADVPVAIFSLEMSREQLSLRLLCAEAMVDASHLRTGRFDRDAWLRLTDAASNLSEAPIFIDDAADISAMEIRAKARRLKMEKGLGLIVIDYLQLMRGRSDAERRDLEISEISRSLKALAKELNVPVIALSQLNRMLEQRADKRPMLSDLRESGSLEQDADVVMFIYRDEVYNKEDDANKGAAEVIIGKQRNGPVGTAHLAFMHQYTKFENKASDDYLDIE